MSLKFYDNTNQTFNIMKALYDLGIIIGINTATCILYLTYKYFNKKTMSQDKNQQEPFIQMEKTENIIQDKELHKLLLEQKRDELNVLIDQLDKIYDNIYDIKQQLDEINNQVHL